jgi:peptidoglycan hydrolase-like protein with peptidoglycan-binding domain
MVLILALLFALIGGTTPPDIRANGGKRSAAAKAPPERRLTKATIREAESTLAELGYWTGPVDGVLDECSRQALVAFQKIEGRTVTGKLTVDELDAILAAAAPDPFESGYEHVEVDIARQVLFFVAADGTIARITPVSTGNNEVFRLYGEPNRAYTPRGRFAVYAKGTGWQESPLGLLYYPSYLIGGIAIHGNPAVPPKPESHGCIRVPMCVAKEIAALLPVGTKVLVHDAGSLANGLVPWPDEPDTSPEESADR